MHAGAHDLLLIHRLSFPWPLAGAELQEEPICCRLQQDLAAVGRRGPTAQQGEGEQEGGGCCGVCGEEEEGMGVPGLWSQPCAAAGAGMMAVD